ncbi:MAG: MEDS domain-containing protein [Fusobacteriaceae bacterium]|nr:MEDS domain-containing protein [Fusobacteriaceae bacterium]
MKKTNHIILFYDSIKSKKNILYPFIAEGLENGKGSVYIGCEETKNEIREGLAKIGVDVEPNELSGNIILKNYDEWYIEKNRVDAYKITEHFKNAIKNFENKGLGTRVVGEVGVFFKMGKVKELLRYEYSLHKTISLPMEAICAYNLKTIVETNYTEVIMPLIRAHGKAIFVSENGNILIEPEGVEDTDIEKLLDIQI